MLKRLALSCALLLSASMSAVRADENPTYSGPLSASEKSFVSTIQADLMQRFPTADEAVKAGYVRYTNPDDTGAISYANQQWQSADVKHPSQLWFDKNGKLLGADYSVLTSSSPQRPQKFGVNPGRWYLFDEHIHYVLKNPSSGAYTYDHYIMAKDFRAAGGDTAHPSAADLVKMGKVKSASSVATVFDFPSLWDLIVWVRPNPSGAFAVKNPAVKP